MTISSVSWAQQAALRQHVLFLFLVENSHPTINGKNMGNAVTSRCTETELASAWRTTRAKFREAFLLLLRVIRCWSKKAKLRRKRESWENIRSCWKLWDLVLADVTAAPSPTATSGGFKLRDMDQIPRCFEPYWCIEPSEIMTCTDLYSLF